MSTLSISGIEVWSEGAPARPFQILGTLTDDRLIGSYFGASRTGYLKVIADGAKAAGGDAAVLDQAAPTNHMRLTEPATRNMRQFLNGSAVPSGESAYTVRFWVVKYLTDAPAETGLSPQ